MVICWLFVDKPGAPENLQVSDVYAEHCKLSWNPPTDDGGSEVTGKARFPFKCNRLRCVRCVNENRKKRKRLRFLRFSI